MNVWVTAAAGILTGLTVFVSLGGFSRGKKEENNTVNNDREFSSSEIPDEILDGPLEEEVRPSSGKHREQELRSRTEKGVRDFQEGLNKLSNVIGNLANAVTSIMRIFYEEPAERVTPSMIIY